MHFIEEEGGFLRVNQQDGKVQSIVFATAKQLAEIERSQPNVNLLDMTYGCCSEKYKTACIVYPCSLTGGTRIACTALLLNETTHTVQKFLEQYQSIFAPNFFFVDKDFGQMEVLRLVFPNSRILLCAFHTIKYIGTLFATLHSTKHKDIVPVKRDLFQLFKRMVNARSQSQFDNAWNELKEVGNHCTVRRKTGIVPLVEYLEKNWISCVDMWSRVHRMHLPIRFTYTTNRVSNFLYIKLNLTLHLFRLKDSLV